MVNSDSEYMFWLSDLTICVGEFVREVMQLDGLVRRYEVRLQDRARNDGAS